MLGEFLSRDQLFVLDDLPEPGAPSIEAGATGRIGLIHDVDGELDEARPAYEAAGDVQCLVPGRFRPTFDPACNCERRLRRLGVRNAVMSVVRLFDELGRRRVPPIGVQTLGGFRVMLSGVPIADDAWQSRKARTLLKILIARRGRPVHREVLMEILGSGVDPFKSSNRLSVALSTLRGVLDPGRAHPGDHVVAADRGLEAYRRGDRDQASWLLERADVRYRGRCPRGGAHYLCWRLASAVSGCARRWWA